MYIPFRLSPRVPWGLMTAFRLLLGGLFLWACATKFQQPQTFFAEMEAYLLVPSVLVPAVAWILIGTEGLVGLGLLLNVRRRTCAAVAAGLLVLFLAVAGSVHVRNLHISCGCFGGSEPISWRLWVRDLVLLFLAWLLAQDEERTDPMMRGWIANTQGHAKT